MTIVTGAARGIGRGIALAVGREGANVTLVDRDEQGIRAVSKELADIGASSCVVAGDVGDPDVVARAVTDTIHAFGRIDSLVNNAQAIRAGVPFEEHADEDLEIALASGLWGTFRFMRACFPALRVRGGSIVNMASSAGTHGLPGAAGYAAAKEGIRGLTKVAANEWGVHGIRVNAICPQAVTPVAQAYFEEHPERLAEKLAARPIKRDGHPENDIGRSVVYLIGPDSSFMTGMTLMINGGLTIMP